MLLCLCKNVRRLDTALGADGTNETLVVQHFPRGLHEFITPSEILNQAVQADPHKHNACGTIALRPTDAYLLPRGQVIQIPSTEQLTLRNYKTSGVDPTGNLGTKAWMSNLSHLDLINCDFNTAALQHILTMCPRLIHFKVLLNPQSNERGPDHRNAGQEVVRRLPNIENLVLLISHTCADPMATTGMLGDLSGSTSLKRLEVSVGVPGICQGCHSTTSLDLGRLLTPSLDHFSVYRSTRYEWESKQIYHGVIVKEVSDLLVPASPFRLKWFATDIPDLFKSSLWRLGQECALHKGDEVDYLQDVIGYWSVCRRVERIREASFN